MTKWEYRVIELGAGFIGVTQDRLNDLGRDGWEVAAVVPRGVNHTIILKRVPRDMTSFIKNSAAVPQPT
jgi:hypothetical protein